MLFDTLELSKALQPSFTPAQADALVKALGKASVEQLATKADLAELKTDIAELRTSTKADVVGLKADLAELKTSTKADIAELKADIAELRTSTQADIAELRASTNADISALKSDVATLKGDISTLRSDLTGVITSQISLLRAETIKWIVSALAFNFMATAGLIVTLIKVFGK